MNSVQQDKKNWFVVLGRFLLAWQAIVLLTVFILISSPSSSESLSQNFLNSMLDLFFGPIGIVLYTTSIILGIFLTANTETKRIGVWLIVAPVAPLLAILLIFGAVSGFS